MQALSYIKALELLQFKVTGTFNTLLNLKKSENLPNVDQANPKMTTTNLTANKAVVCLASKMRRHTINATFNGRMQYPSTQTLWKNDLK